MDEFDLIKKIVKGNRDSFNILFEKYKNYSYKISLHVLKNEDDALDNVNNAWMKIYAALIDDKFNFKSKFSTWIYKIILNEALMSLKIRMKEIPFNDTKIDESQIMDVKSYIDNIEDKEDRELRIKKIMKFLNPRQKQIIKFLLEGYKFSEIADKLRITPNHLYQLTSRIKKMLKNIS